MPQSAWTVLACILSVWAALLPAAEPIVVHKRSRALAPSGDYVLKTHEEAWRPSETAIIVCDMWDAHHCLNAVRRELELAPRMNEVLTAARAKGVFIIHAPSSCMAAYAEHPGRKLAMAAPAAKNLPPNIANWLKQIPSEEQCVYPIDQTDGGEDDDPEEHRRWHEQLAAQGRNPKAPWKKQIDLLEIQPGDAISDSGVEIWNLLEARGLKNVILMGVHTNMCVLGRPFGLRQLASNGKNTVLMRDLTDTMYNPARPPYVSHFAGTELIIEHIEKAVCPTITSTVFVGGQPFRYQADLRKLVFLIGDDEYKTEITLPKFAETVLAPLGLETTFIHADPQDKNRFPGMAAAVAAADLVVVSARRRLPPKEDLDALRRHIAAGKPVLGIRTASHAWSLRTAADAEKLLAAGHAAWPEFDAQVLGGNYSGHHGAGVKTAVTLASGAAEHPILRGVEVEKLVGHGSLYKTSPLAASAQPLLIGAIPDKPAEPVLWTHRAGDKRSRVSYTSLGHLDDFENPAFRKLLLGAVFWCLESDTKPSEKLP